MPINLGAVYEGYSAFRSASLQKRSRRREARALLAAARKTNEQLQLASDRLRSTQRALSGAAGVDLGSVSSLEDETRAALFLEQQRVLRGAGISANNIFRIGRAEEQATKKAGTLKALGGTPYGGLF